MASPQFVMSAQVHDALVSAAYMHRGFDAEESAAAARFSNITARHGIKTHNAIKALHLDEHFGSRAGGCVPRATIEKLPLRYKAVARWNANRKLGQAVAIEAMKETMRLADEFGVGVVVVDNAFHYLWGGGYVIDAAERGYIAYTGCTSALAEVVPFGGKFPTLGTNPHSWAFPTTPAIGFPVCIDWATSVVAMGRVQQFLREGKQLPPGCGVDQDGNETTDPAKITALMPFGQHKGYGLSLLDELIGAYTGGSLPTLRSRPNVGHAQEKRTPTFFFQCMRPDAIECGDFALQRTQVENVKAVIADILGHGNDRSILPGQLEAQSAAQSDRLGGLIFTAAEVDAFEQIANDANHPFDRAALRAV